MAENDDREDLVGMALLHLLKGAETISSLRDRSTAATMACTAIIHILAPTTFCWLRAQGEGKPMRVLARSGPKGPITGEKAANAHAESLALNDIFLRHPEALGAIDAHATRSIPAADGGWRVALPFYHAHDRLDSLLLAECESPPSPEQEDGIRCFLHFYVNYLALLDYSELDTLIGLRNRKTFEDMLERLVNEPRAAGADPLWLALLDIDNFKYINDTWGHIFGDETLLRFSRMLKASFRSEDQLFRFGGEEFVAIIRARDDALALSCLERFRTALEATEFPQIGTMTCSIGFTRFDPERLSSETLEQADRALYYAKSNGRNRTCHYDTLLAQGLIEVQDPLEGRAALDFDIDALFA
ncbi:MAG: GGDEF domain-containing protein [Porticoccaceae bacterium]